MNRISRKMVEAQFEFLKATLGEPTLSLDYISCYGGYRIESHGGAKTPFGHSRMSAKETFNCIQFALRAIQLDRAGFDSHVYWPEAKLA